MKIRDDMTVSEHVPFHATAWTPSPEPSVTRKMLERDGGEVARATSIVRYAPNSSFPEHVHERGEEFVVLEGTFSDEHGDYPVGTYVRNPPRSAHSPFSSGGCTIFVKLRQIEDADTRHCVIDLGLDDAARNDSCEQTPLHAFGAERVSLVRLAAHASQTFDQAQGGVELLVLSGSLEVAGISCGPWSWLRMPQPLGRVHSQDGCAFWMKTGHIDTGAMGKHGGSNPG